MKKQQFYVFDEHTDYLTECRKIGFSIYRQNTAFENTLELSNIMYRVLGRNDCYSGWEINIVEQKEFDFEELLFIALNSCIYDEKVVSIGLILKNYYSDFIDELRRDFQPCNLKHSQKKLLKLILKDVCKKSYQVGNMDELLEICCMLLKNERFSKH